MMNKSRKNISRGEIRRRRQLRKRRQREESREDKSPAREEFTFWQFLKKFKIEILCVVFLIGAVSAVIVLGPDQNAVKEKEESVSALLIDRSWVWKEAYPYGYKIIALTDKEIVETSFDTLPIDLKINWKKMSVVRIQANQLKHTEEKIKIALDNINYAPEDVSGMAVTTAFSRTKGVVSKLTRLGKLELVVQVLEDDGNSVFCLFGLRGE